MRRLKASCFLLSCFFLIGSTLSAAPYSWNNPVGGDVYTPSNWDPFPPGGPTRPPGFAAGDTWTLGDPGGGTLTGLVAGDRIGGVISCTSTVNPYTISMPGGGAILDNGASAAQILVSGSQDLSLTGGPLSFIPSLQLNVASSRTLTLSPTGTTNISVITGTGTVVMSATGYSGLVTISAGTVRVFSGGDLGTAQLTIGAAGTLQVMETMTLTNSSISSVPASTIEVANSKILTGVLVSAAPVGFTKTGEGTFVASVTGGGQIGGNVTLQAGTLSLSDRLLVLSTLSIGDGATLRATNTFSLGGSCSLGGATSTVEVTDANNMTLASILASAGALNKTGTGTLTVAGTNGYTGGTNIQEGILKLNAAGATPLGSASSTAIIGSMGTLQGAQTLTAANPITLNPGSTIDVASTKTLTLSGVISGASGTLTKTSDGTLTLTGVNSYGGGTTINAGTLKLSGTGALSSTGAVSVNSATSVFDISATAVGASIGDLSGLASSSVTLGSRALTVNEAGSTTFAGIISDTGSGSLTKALAGTLTLTGANSYLGGTTINDGTLRLSVGGSLHSTGAVNVNSATSVFDISLTTAGTAIGNLSGAALSSITLGSRPLTVNEAGNTTFNGTISGAGGSLTKAGIGTLTLTGANTYAGTTTISTGTLSLSGTTPPSLVSPVDVAAATTLDISGATAGASIGALTGAVGSFVTLGNNALTVNEAGNTTFNGIISDTGSGSLTKAGAGILTFTGVNAYAGGTTINTGTLSLSVGGTLDPAGAVSVDGGTFDISTTTAGTSIGDLSGVGSGFITLGNKLLTINQSGDTAFAGSISGLGGPLTKAGAGTLTLSGSNTYTGATTVNAGTLNLSGSLTSPVTVDAAGTLMGTGHITGDVVIDGTMAMGASVGTMTITGDYTHHTGSNLQVEVTPTSHDLLLVSHDVHINPGATLTVIPQVGFYPNNTLYLVIDEGNTFTGTFDLVAISPPLIRVTALYHASLSLLINSTPLPDIIVSGNASKIAHCFDFTTLPADDDFENVEAQLLFLDTIPQIIDAVDQMQPSALKALPLTQETASTLVQDAVNQRQKNLYFPTCSRHYFQQWPWTVWATGLGSWGRQKQISDNVGYSNEVGGAILGFDRNITSYIRLGAAGSYTHSTVTMHRERGSGELNSYYLTPYFAVALPHWYLNFSATGLFAQSKGKRRIQFGAINRTAVSHPNAYGAQGHVDTGLTFGKGTGTLYPFIGLDTLWQREDSFTERGADSIDLHIDASHYLLYRARAGLGLTACIKRKNWNYVPRVEGSYVREERPLGSHYHGGFTSRACTFTVKGLSPDRNLLEVAAELSCETNEPNLSLSLRYDGQFASRYHQNSGTVSLGFSF